MGVRVQVSFCTTFFRIHDLGFRLLGLGFRSVGRFMVSLSFRMATTNPHSRAVNTASWQEWQFDICLLSNIVAFDDKQANASLTPDDKPWYTGRRIPLHGTTSIHRIETL